MNTCSIVMGVKTIVIATVKAITEVTLKFLRILLLIRIPSANILRDFTERTISKYFMMTTQVQLWALSKKKLHSNQKMSSFLACQPITTIKNQGSTCDHRFRFTSTVSNRILMPARQMLNSISRIQAAPSVDTSTSHPFNPITALSPEQLISRIPCHSRPPVDTETLNRPSTFPKLRGLRCPKSILMVTEGPPVTNWYSQAEGWMRTMVRRLLPSKVRADPFFLPKIFFRSSSQRRL